MADDLVQAFLSVKSKLNFISLIYNDWEWNGAGQKFPHAGHKTHIHIEWSGSSMNHTGYEADLGAAVAAVKPADDTDFEFDDSP